MTDLYRLTAREREACYLARTLNRGGTPRTLRKWEERAEPFQPLVNALRPHIAIMDKMHCMAKADSEAIEAERQDRLARLQEQADANGWETEQ